MGLSATLLAGAELRAIMVGHDGCGAARRQRHSDIVSSPEFKQPWRDYHVILSQWFDLQKVLNQKGPFRSCQSVVPFVFV